MMAGNSIPRIQVFRPTMEEFRDFSGYIEKIESTGAHKAGLAKIIPPEEWCPRKGGYDDINLIIPAPIQQIVTGREGLFNQYNMQKKAMSVKEFQKLAESPKYRTPSHFDYEDLERKYWRNIAYNPPIYGADISGSLYDKDVKEFNIQHLNTILDLVKEDYEIQIEGVNTAYLYFGMWKTTFAWHTEDMDLYSINYLHFGAPKSWYAVPPEHGRRLERLAQNYFHSSYSSCAAFLRHKMTIIAPHILKNHSIPFNKITQEPGEFMITFPFGYHAGFNHGYNCAESTNFALPRWVEYGKRASSCTCRNDCVKICMDMFVRKFQPERYELWKMGRDVGPHPEEPSKVYAAPPPNKLELALAAQRMEQKKTKMGGGGGYQKIKRHPISKPKRTKFKMSTVAKADEEDGDTKETEIYDVDDIDADNDNFTENVDNSNSCGDIEQDLIKIREHKNSSLTKGNEVFEDYDKQGTCYDEDTEEIILPNVENESLYSSPPPLIAAESPVCELSSLESETADAQSSILDEELLNQYPSFKNAINSGALKLTCIDPCYPTSIAKQMSVITIGICSKENPPKLIREGSSGATSLEGADSTNEWTCKQTQGLKVKFVQPKQNASHPTLKKVTDITTESCKIQRNKTVSNFISVAKDASCSKTVESTTSSSNVLTKQAAGNAEKTDMTSGTDADGSSSVDKPKERKRCRRDSKSSSSKVVKAASDSSGNWALPILELWHHRPFDFEEEQKFNMHCSSIKPHCCICMIFSPIEITKNYPNPPNDSVYRSKVNMPAFCFGNGIDNQCILDQNPLLSKEGNSSLLVCECCKISVHAACYGVTMIHLDSPTWMCSRCSKNALDAQCCLCVLRGGALKPTDDGRWAHVLCAIIIPEIYFENIILKEPINLSKLTPTRWKLKCKYCLKSTQSQVPVAGACIQCLSGKCYLPFHVTCGYVAGVVYEANDWPSPIHVMCTKHVGARKKPPKRLLTPVNVGDKVLAKHSNRRWYWVEVQNTYIQEFYSVLFEDNSTSINTLPEDIVYREYTTMGNPDINEKIRVKWTDGKIYSALFKGSRSCEIYVVEFDDGKVLSLERSQIYAQDEHIPRMVITKMSHSSERHDHFQVPSEGKRRRIANQKYSQDT